MKKIISTEKKDILLWLEDIDQETLRQVKNLANFPFTFHHVAVMADAHVGYGMPIGGVLAVENVIIPNAVGVDIGCGVCAVKTGLHNIETMALKDILGEIRKVIPLGAKHQSFARPEYLMPETEFQIINETMPIVACEYKRARKQLGTLGGGNHFIEIQYGSDNHIWLMVHSGSRNLGYRVASYYNKQAVRFSGSKDSLVPKKWDLAYLELRSRLGADYFREMEYCTAFAKVNRREMMSQVMKVVTDVTECDAFDEMLDVAHNYASAENHFGKDVVVHRKGATKVGKSEFGIIPGSQGSASFIVCGRGNPDSFYSCSHGAGRKYGRKQAQRKLNLQEEISKLEQMNVLHSVRGKRDLDEAPGAYKNIDTVMANQADLVEVVVTLTPLAVVKG